MALRYAFDSKGGFAVIDTEKRLSAYAYASSTDAEKAKSRPEQVARRMIKTLLDWPISNETREGCYQHTLRTIPEIAALMSTMESP